MVALGVLGALAGAWVDSALGSTPVAPLYVSPKGSNQGPCTQQDPCRTISHAVAVAHPGSQINIAAGTYRQEVTLTKRLTLVGSHAPEIDAKGHGRGILIKGARAAGSEVRGLVVEGATYEGILALLTERVSIFNNLVRDNDRGYFVRPFKGECQENGVPEPRSPAGPQSHTAAAPRAHIADLRSGGCGEAIHLASTSHSQVSGNLVTGNTGGIYLTDESAPAAHNLITGNVVEDNLYDCGITLASHSERAVSRQGQLRPTVGGVYDNTITHNVSNLNGLRVPGAGVLVAAAYPGSAAYGNRIIANSVAHNGLPGVTLHSHETDQNLDGNVILDNIVGPNALGGRTGGPGDGDGGVHKTTGILVWSAFTKITGTRIAGNRISYDHFGIWTDHVPPVKQSTNRYGHVRVPLEQHNT